MASFILILIMAMSRPGGRPSPRCDVSNCRVSCAGVQFNENEEEDVISIATVTLKFQLSIGTIISVKQFNVHFGRETLELLHGEGRFFVLVYIFPG